MRRRKKIEKSGRGITLASKWRKGFFPILFSRLGLVLIMLLIQILMMSTIWYFFGQILGRYFIGGQTLFELIVLIFLFNSPMDSSAKLSWTLLIAVMPLFGTLFYVWTNVEMGHRTIKRKLNVIAEETKQYMIQSESAVKKLKSLNRESSALAKYLFDYGNAPVYDNVRMEYYPFGEDKFPRMLEELEKAKEFIFLEFFIIEEGYLWGRVLEILSRKVQEGVEVRVMYDGTCEFANLPPDYPKRLQKIGIQCKIWERIKPVVTSAYNYRDHRKVMIIDGKVAFCGGDNLADEYINRVERFGHWKDASVMLRGAAVDSFTLMYLQMWNVTSKNKDDFGKYLNKYEKGLTADGCVIPYGESPLNNHKIAERVYMDMLYTAKDYVYVMTPYLILDDELTAALRYAAERGVDVCLILPGIPDKMPVWALAKKHYRSLLDAGVKIYEYTPGFVHAKVVISDNIKAVVGTINFDYRSLYHHFECAAYMVGIPCIKDIREDFTETLSKCRTVTYESMKHEKLYLKAVGSVLKLIAPLL